MALDFLEIRDANGVIKRVAVDVDPADSDNTYQAIKVAFGPADTFTLVSGTDGLPVAQQGPWTVTLAAGTANIGDVDVLSLPALPAGTNNIGDVDVLSLPALPAGTNNIGDVDVLSLPATTNAGAAARTADLDTGAGTDVVTLFGLALPASGGAAVGGTAANPIRTDPTGTTVQPISGTVAATQSGSWTVQPGNTANTTAWLVTGTGGTFPATQSGAWTVTANAGTGTFGVGGVAAHDAAVSGSPVLLGGYASTAAPAAVSADGDAVRLWADRSGRLQVGDGGGSLTVDGTVAATQSGTWTVTGTGGTFPVTDGGASLTVDGTVAATQSGTWTVTGAGGTFPVTDGGGSLTVDGTVGVSGTVAVDTELPAAAALADAAANPTTPIAGSATLVFNGTTWDRARGDVTNGLDVDVTRVSGTVTVAAHDVGSITAAVVPGTGATHLGKAEDAAHATGDVGVMALAVRRAAPANLASADGDYEPLQVAGGRLWASVTVDSALPAGTNNIGDVDVLTLPALPAGTNNIGDVDVLSLPAIPAGTNVIGRVAAGLETGAIYEGATALTPKFALANASASGDTAIVAGVGGKRIRVLAFAIGPVSASVNVHLRSATTPIQSTKYLAANSGYGRAFSPAGHCETAVGAALNINLSAAVNVGVDVVYCEVT